MRKFFLIISILFTIVSCGWQKPETPKHFIYGKWRSSTGEIFLIFNENNTVKAERFSRDGKVYETNHQFSIIDLKTVEVEDKTQPEYKVKVKVRETEKDVIKLDCFIGKSKDGKTMVDPPTICHNTGFIRARE